MGENTMVSEPTAVWTGAVAQLAELVAQADALARDDADGRARIVAEADAIAVSMRNTFDENAGGYRELYRSNTEWRDADVLGVRSTALSREIAQLFQLLKVNAAEDVKDHRRYRAEMLRQFRRVRSEADQTARTLESFRINRVALESWLAGDAAGLIVAIRRRIDGWRGLTPGDALHELSHDLERFAALTPELIDGAKTRAERLGATFGDDGELLSRVLPNATDVARAIETNPYWLLPVRGDYLLFISLSLISSFFFLYLIKNGTTEMWSIFKVPIDFIASIPFADYDSQVPLPWFPFNSLILISPLIFYALYRSFLTMGRSRRFRRLGAAISKAVRRVGGAERSDLENEFSVSLVFSAPGEAGRRSPQATGGLIKDRSERVGGFLQWLGRGLQWSALAIGVPAAMTIMVFFVARALLEYEGLELGGADATPELQQLHLQREDGSLCAVAEGRVFWSLFGVYLVATPPSEDVETRRPVLERARFARARMDAVFSLLLESRSTRTLFEMRPEIEAELRRRLYQGMIDEAEAAGSPGVALDAYGDETLGAVVRAAAYRSGTEADPEVEQAAVEAWVATVVAAAEDDGFGPLDVAYDDEDLGDVVGEVIDRLRAIPREIELERLRNSVVVVQQRGRAISVAAADLDGDGVRDVEDCVADRDDRGAIQREIIVPMPVASIVISETHTSPFAGCDDDGDGQLNQRDELYCAGYRSLIRGSYADPRPGLPADLAFDERLEADRRAAEAAIAFFVLALRECATETPVTIDVIGFASRVSFSENSLADSNDLNHYLAEGRRAAVISILQRFLPRENVDDVEEQLTLLNVDGPRPALSVALGETAQPRFFRFDREADMRSSLRRWIGGDSSLAFELRDDGEYGIDDARSVLTRSAVIRVIGDFGDCEPR